MRRQYEAFRLAAMKLLKAGVPCVGELGLQRLHLRLIGQRTDDRIGCHGVTHLEFPDTLDDQCGEIRVERTLDNDPIGTHAYLTLVEKTPNDSGMSRQLDVSVLQDNQRAIAAQFQGNPLEVGAASSNPSDISPNLSRTREGNQTRHRVLDERITDFRAGTDQDVDHPAGNPASSNMCAISNPPLTAVSLAGLSTTVLPSAMAGTTERILK